MGELSQIKPFEAEVRFLLDDVSAIKAKIEEHNLSCIREYAFADHYFTPTDTDWNPMEKTIRIRVWDDPALPTAVWLTKEEVIDQDGVQCKRSLYPEGKRKLFEGELEACKQVLADLGFKPLFTITKIQGSVWQDANQSIEFCIEETDLLGWTGEIEAVGTDLKVLEKTIARHQQFLGLRDEQLTYKSVAALVLEKKRSK